MRTSKCAAEHAQIAVRRAAPVGAMHGLLATKAVCPCHPTLLTALHPACSGAESALRQFEHRLEALVAPWRSACWPPLLVWAAGPAAP